MFLPLLLGTVVAPPEPMYTIDRETLKPAETVLAQTLQGLTARKAPRIWIATKGVQETLLKNLEKERPVETADVWGLVKRFRGEVKGAIVYKLGTPSLSVASGLCGPMNAVAIDESLVDAAKGAGLNVVLDVRGMTEKDAFAKYRSLYAKGFVVEQGVDKPGHLRDFAVRHSAFVMDTEDREFRKQVIRAFGPNPLVFGWGKDEYRWVEDVSAAGGTGVPSDWAANLSVLESLPASKKLQPPTPRPMRLQDGTRYVAFVMSDGDNVQWMTNDFVTGKSFYASPIRGRFPISWEVSALLSRFAPRVLEHIYAKATPNDDFVAGPGLPGYSFAHVMPDRPGAAQASAPYLRESGLSLVSFLNANDGTLSELAPWMNLPEVAGAIYKDYSPYHRRRGETAWINGKAVAAYRFLLWENLQDIDALTGEIAAMPTSGDRFALVNIHAWSYGSIGGPLEAMQKVVERLGPETRVVTASQLFQLMREAKG